MRKFGFWFILAVCMTVFAAVTAQSAADDAVASVKPHAAYCDENGVLKMLAFEIDEVPEGLTFTVEDKAFPVTVSVENVGAAVIASDGTRLPDHKFVFQPMQDAPAVSAVRLNVVFAAGDAQKSAEIPVVRIIEGSTDDWTVSGDGHALETYTGEGGSVTVPNFIGGKAITCVAGGAGSASIVKASGRTISAAVISNGITDIGYGAFSNMKSLSSVILPDTLENIGMGGFYGTGLAQELTFPPSLKYIGIMAFQNSALAGIKLNDGLETIDHQAFYQCGNMAGKLELPQTLTRLGNRCFMQCSALTGDLVIPPGVRTVPLLAFCNCTGFDGKLVLSEGVEETGYITFGGVSAYMHFKELKLPSTMKHIGQYSFQNCVDIGHLELNEGLEFISDGAFDHMSGIDNETLVIPSTVKMIGGDYDVEENTGYGDHVFYDMGKDKLFRAFEVAEGNEWFKAVDGVLYDAALTRMVAYPRGRTDEVFALPNTVTQLDAMAFSRPAYLKKLVLSDSLIIDDTVPQNSLNMDGNDLAVALYAYNNLEEVAVNDTNPNYAAKDGVLYSKDMKSVWYIPQAARGDVEIDPACERMEKGCVYIASFDRVKWDSLKLPPSVSYIDTDTRAMLNETLDGSKTKRVSDRIEYAGEAYIVYLAGDADLSGEVTREDSHRVLYGISHNDKTVYNAVAADVNRDNKVDVTDAILILQRI
ncbi:MAG: leucine-rich repeat protein [Firmicutes bacterium]|nr:leucine-rich repeat protein [Bacillota bacterium]